MHSCLGSRQHKLGGAFHLFRNSFPDSGETMVPQLSALSGPTSLCTIRVNHIGRFCRVLLCGAIVHGRPAKPPEAPPEAPHGHVVEAPLDAPHDPAPQDARPAGGRHPLPPSPQRPRAPVECPRHIRRVLLAREPVDVPAMFVPAHVTARSSCTLQRLVSVPADTLSCPRRRPPECTRTGDRLLIALDPYLT